MTEPKRLDKAQLAQHFRCDAIAFLGRSSFEKRSFSAFLELSECNFRYKHFFYSREETDISRDLRARYVTGEQNQSEIDTRNPLNAKKAIDQQVEIISSLPTQVSLVIDITTFRREELLILLKALSALPSKTLAETSFVYSIASSMGSWLSNNVRQIRPVIGYPGEVMSRRGTHLVILAGVEQERAISAIDAYEPTHISLGIVPLEDSISLNIHERNVELRNYLVRHFDNVTTEFDFSAKDPSSIVSMLEVVTAKRPNLNTVIAPLNTKLSTIGCGVFALQHPEVQLCYAEVDVYNASSYSEPGDEVLVVPYRELVSPT